MFPAEHVRWARRPVAAAVTPTSTVELGTSLAGLDLRNPILTASGSAGTGVELAPYLDVAELGALVTPSVQLLPHEGARTPRMAETPSGMLSHVGLPGPGIDALLTVELPQLVATGARVVVSIAGSSVAEYAELARRLARTPGVSAIEVHLACRDAATGQRFSATARTAAEVVAAVRRELPGGPPVFAKLSPAVQDLSQVAGACVDAGADGLTLIAGLRGMVLDKRTLRPTLSAGTGDLSGPAIRPVALRSVYEVHAALPHVPLIGVGGIRTGQDALEFLAAGATAVQVGTTIFGDPSAPMRIVGELVDTLLDRGIAHVRDVVGLAHRT